MNLIDRKADFIANNPMLVLIVAAILYTAVSLVVILGVSNAEKKLAKADAAIQKQDYCDSLLCELDAMQLRLNYQMEMLHYYYRLMEDSALRKPAAYNNPTKQACYRFTCLMEGGYGVFPAQYGGETNKGIIKSTYYALRGHKATEQEFYAMPDTAHRYLFDCFWTAMKCDSIRHPALQMFVNDCGFHMGTPTAAFNLAAWCNTPLSYSVTSELITKINTKSSRELFNYLCDKRMEQANASPYANAYIRRIETLREYGNRYFEYRN